MHSESFLQRPCSGRTEAAEQRAGSAGQNTQEIPVAGRAVLELQLDFAAAFSSLGVKRKCPASAAAAAGRRAPLAPLLCGVRKRTSPHRTSKQCSSAPAAGISGSGSEGDPSSGGGYVQRPCQWRPLRQKMGERFCCCRLSPCQTEFSRGLLGGVCHAWAAADCAVQRRNARLQLRAATHTSATSPSKDTNNLDGSVF